MTAGRFSQNLPLVIDYNLGVIDYTVISAKPICDQGKKHNFISVVVIGEPILRVNNLLGALCHLKLMKHVYTFHIVSSTQKIRIQPRVKLSVTYRVDVISFFTWPNHPKKPLNLIC